MKTHKYIVLDNSNKIEWREFTDFDEAVRYAKDGIISFVVDVPIIDEVADEWNSSIVWSWDNIST